MLSLSPHHPRLAPPAPISASNHRRLPPLKPHSYSVSAADYKPCFVFSSCPAPLKKPSPLSSFSLAAAADSLEPAPDAFLEDEEEDQFEAQGETEDGEDYEEEEEGELEDDLDMEFEDEDDEEAYEVAEDEGEGEADDEEEDEYEVIYGEERKARMVLKFIWMEKNIGVGLEKEIPGGKGSVPLTPYYFWPRKDAWEELKARLEERDYVSQKRMIILLNQTTDIINLWQQSSAPAPSA